MCVEGESVTDAYEHLTKAIILAAEEHLPIRKKAKKTDFAENPEVMRIREEVQTAFHAFSQKPTRLRQRKLQVEKAKLQQAYEKLTAEDLEQKLDDIENANQQHQHAKSWNLINSLTDRNASKKGIIKANSKEEQIQKWYNHFKDLLGKQPNVEGEIEVHQILPPQNINEDDFSIEEYEKAK